MVIQQVRLDVLDGRSAAFETALVEVRQRVFMSAGFRGFTVAQGAEHATSYLVEVRWETLDELAAAAERLERAWAPVRPFLARAPLIEHFHERPALGLAGPGVVTDLTWATD